MSTSVLDERIADFKTQERAAADARREKEIAEGRREYFTILRRRHDPQTNDARDILRAMNAADISEQDHTGYQRQADRLHELRGKIITPEQIEKCRNQLLEMGAKASAQFRDDLLVFFGLMKPAAAMSMIGVLTDSILASLNTQTEKHDAVLAAYRQLKKTANTIAQCNEVDYFASENARNQSAVAGILQDVPELSDAAN